MTVPDFYGADLLAFFDGRPRELSLYQTLFSRLESLCPDGSVKVQRTQISFYCGHLFAAASLPIRRRKGWPEHCLMVTIGLGRRLDSPRVAVAVEPYPNRWTHHILITREEQVDDELLRWLEEACRLAREKAPRRPS